MPSLFFADLVRERCVGTGSGALPLAGALAGHRRFADAVPEEASFHYAIAGVTHPGEWETGTGAIDGEGRLRRDGVAASSNGGAAVDFSAGVKTVALIAGAGWYAVTDAALADQDAALAGYEAALAGKQPLSTGHSSASAVEASDAVTVRRGGGWVNVPAAALVHQRSGGGFVCTGNLGVGEEAPGQRLVVRGSSAVDGSAPVAVEISDAQAGAAGWTNGAVFAALNFRSADNSVAGAGVRAQVAAAMPVSHGGATDLKLSATGSALLDRSVVLESTGRFRPGSDNSQPLGWTSSRWSTVHAATGAIQTSDAREKAWRGPADAAELRAARRMLGELGFFQWHDAIALKGTDAARRHFGVRAQAAWAIMAEEGLVDPLDADGAPGACPYAFLCHDRWQDADGEWHDRFGVRSDQLALFLVAALAAEMGLGEIAA
ncbi:MAG TPA: hypothetical protein PKD99_06450 [Sphingopyxis sp.]|nr:hypothetical protein [Sphingopyxis sp.]HMP44729.1 hypothetical protein [Sphingopyxis sp.]HMQ19925.1 hypothetical protein [Sphingopyxis sp.]